MCHTLSRALGNSSEHSPPPPVPALRKFHPLSESISSSVSCGWTSNDVSLQMEGRLVPEGRWVKPETSCGMWSEPREQMEGGGVVRERELNVGRSGGETLSLKQQVQSGSGRRQEGRAQEFYLS